MATAPEISSAEVFAVRGWDIERYDPDYVVEMIHKAHAAGMNTISLSHEVVMNAEEILWDWHRYKHLRRFCDEAHALGMSVYMWNHQVNNPPEVVSDGLETILESVRSGLDLSDEGPVLVDTSFVQKGGGNRGRFLFIPGQQSAEAIVSAMKNT